MENTEKRKRGRPRNNLVQYQLRLEPELIQQLRVKVGRGNVSSFVRMAIMKEIKFYPEDK